MAVRAANTRAGKLPPSYVFWMPVGIAGLFLLGGGKKPRLGILRGFLLAGALLIVAVSWFGCGGGSSSTPPPQQTAQTYTITIKATGITATQTVSLTVNP